MANVRPGTEQTGATRSSPRSRGQMLLVAGFGIAVMLVSLALILNTAIFTENVATRSSDIVGGKDAAQFQSSIREGTGGAIEYANYNNNSSYTTLESAVSDSVGSMGNITARQRSLKGRTSNVSVVKIDRGKRVFQETERNFTDVTGDKKWELVDASRGIRNFTLVVNATSLPVNDTGNRHGAFNIFPHEDGNPSDPYDPQHRIFIYNDSSTGKVAVTVENDSSGNIIGTCLQEAGTDKMVNISITDASIDGVECEPLHIFSFYKDIDIAYNNSHQINGTYSFIANGTSGVSLNVPNVSDAVYSVNVNMTFEGRRLAYATEIRVAPKEPEEYDVN